VSLAVVMATYRGARWLPEQLASIGAQTRRPDRLIVSDDGSDDGSVEIVERFAATAPFPVTVLEGPRRGLADNFWHAAAHADEELIAWSDQDDVWHPVKLERCERALRESGSDLVSHSAIVVDASLRARPGRRCPDYPRDARMEALAGDPWHVPSGFASVARRHLLDDLDWAARPISHQTGRPANHDHVVSLRAFASGRRLHLREALARYRQHGSNAAGDPSPRGVDVLRVAFAVGAEQFRALATIAGGYGEFLRATPGVHPGAADYFGALSRRCERRAAVYEAPGPRARLRSLAAAARRGVYAPRAVGSFGVLALAKDAVDIALSAGR